MSHVLKQWETLGRIYRLCPGSAQADGWTRLSPMDARWAVQSYLGEIHSRRTILAPLITPWSQLPTDLTTPGVLERELEAARLVVLAQDIPPIIPRGASLARPLEASRAIEARREAGWIEITVVDDSEPARPLRGARYHLSLPGDSTRQGTLDGTGHLRVDGIEPGRAWLDLSALGLLPPES